MTPSEMENLNQQGLFPGEAVGGFKAHGKRREDNAEVEGISFDV